MRGAVRPGGAVAVYVWDYAGEVQLMRRFWEATAELDPAARELDEGHRFPICNLSRYGLPPVSVGVPTDAMGAF